MEELSLFSVSSIILAGIGLGLSLLVRLQKAKKKTKNWDFSTYMEDTFIGELIDALSVTALMIIANSLMWWVSLKVGSEDAARSVEAITALVIGYGGHGLFVTLKRITVGVFKKYVKKYLDKWFPSNKDN